MSPLLEVSGSVGKLSLILVAQKDVTVVEVRFAERNLLERPLTLKRGKRADFNLQGPTYGMLRVRWLEGSEGFERTVEYRKR